MIRRKVLVTGASSGIGLGATLALTQADIDVFAGVRRERDADRVIEACAGNKGSVTPLILDVTDRPSIARAHDRIASSLGGANLFGLVNNAGIALGGPLLHQPVDEFARVIEVNLIGVMALTQVMAPLLGARPGASGQPGRIVNISSVAGKIAGPFLGAYAASKHGLEAYSDSLRRELMLYDVDVVMIAPGAVKTKIWDKGATQDFSFVEGTDYEAVTRRFMTYFTNEGAKGLPAERLGRLILTALTTQHPKARYAIVPRPLTNWVLPRLLPKRLLDRLLAQRLGLTRR